jgi:hypothetical protein
VPDSAAVTNHPATVITEEQFVTTFDSGKYKVEQETTSTHTFAASAFCHISRPFT